MNLTIKDIQKILITIAILAISLCVYKHFMKENFDDISMQNLDYTDDIYQTSWHTEIVNENEKNLCTVDNMENDLYKFATKQPCGTDPNGCSVCQLKHTDEKEIMEKICKPRVMGSCIIDEMDAPNFDYMKGLMLGTNVYRS